MNENIIKQLYELAFFARGAYEATDNKAFKSIAEDIDGILRDITRQEELPVENHILSGSIDKLDLDMRSRRALHFENINTVSQLIDYTERELLKIPNLGKKSLKVIKEALAEHGLKLKA